MEAIEADMQQLRAAFDQHGGETFAQFAGAWRERQFSLIHCAVPLRIMQTQVQR